MKDFADWIIKIGDRIIGVDNDGVAAPLQSIVEFLLESMNNFRYFEDRTLLAPTLEVVEMVIDFIYSQITSEEKEYLTSDSYCKTYGDVGIKVIWITVEFLNEIKCL